MQQPLFPYQQDFDAFPLTFCENHKIFDFLPKKPFETSCDSLITPFESPGYKEEVSLPRHVSRRTTFAQGDHEVPSGRFQKSFFGGPFWGPKPQNF